MSMMIDPNLPQYTASAKSVIDRGMLAKPKPPDHTNLTDRLFPLGAFDASMRGANTRPPVLLIQVSKIENGYVIGISDSPGSLPRLIYATDLTDVGQQITAFAVARELEGKGAKT